MSPVNPLPALYAKFFGLQADPFSIAPDPRYLFMSERHRDALAHLLYGLRGGGGFVLLTGEIGAGKTTVCRCFLEQIPSNCNVAYIFNPKLTVTELLKTVCDEFHVEHGVKGGEGETVKQYVDPLNEFLLRTHAAGQNNVLIIDEAQNLSAEVLEQLRLLTNLETNERKLLQIILIGQPELRAMLARPELEQLAQRVIARFHLEALSEKETAQYVRHRLGVAGFGGATPFDAAALKRIHQLARGVPRRINLLCDRALLGAYSQGRKRVDLQTLAQAAGEVFETVPNTPAVGPRGRGLLLAGAAVAIVAAGALVVGTAKNGGHVAAGPALPSPAASSSLAYAASASSPASASASTAPQTLSPSISLGLLREADAWRALSAEWKADGVAIDGDASPCAALKQQDLQCFRSDGGLALVRQLDRPGILSLRDESGQPAYVLLVALGNQTATVRAGSGATQTVSLIALSKQWTGEFATLWRAPPGLQERPAPGQLPPETADWLALHLNKILADPAAPLTHSLDGRLQAQVAAFQRSQGLRSDGRPGPITLMQLNRVAGVEEPRLATAAAAAAAAAKAADKP